MAKFRESQPSPDQATGYHPTGVTETPVVEQEPYRHELPRWLHQTGKDPKRVDTVEQCEQAFKDGWRLRPDDSSTKD